MPPLGPTAPHLHFESKQAFRLLFAGTQAEATAWAQQPERSLGQISFLRGVRLVAGVLHGELLVPVPLLGDITLPFASQLTATKQGGVLTPAPLPTHTAEQGRRRGWVEVSGQATALPQTGPSTPIDMQFHFDAFVAVPPNGHFGTAAFEKMVRAAAQRTLDHVAEGLPSELQASMTAPPA